MTKGTAAEYERLVANIVGGICAADQRFKQPDIKKRRTNRIRGASGFEHQIDVSLGQPGVLYLIECKCWKRKIGVAEMLVLVSRARDIQENDKGVSIMPIIVSQAGPTRGAKLIGQRFHVKIARAKSAREFGLQLGQSIFSATGEPLGLRDTVSVAVVEKPKQEGNRRQ
jgi:hypothetical protein